jgi:hypothetical protein
MPVIIKGSAFYFGDEVNASDASFDQFFTWIQEMKSDRSWPYHIKFDTSSDIRRQLYFGSNSDYWFGVFISARTSEFQHFVKRLGDRIVIEARATGGDPPVEMNFFCMRKDSRKGIFSHYRGSYPFSLFLKDFWNCYRSFVEDKKELKLSKLTPGDTKKSIETDYSLQFKARYGPLFTPGSFDELIKRLDTIEEVRLTTYSVDAQEDQPVSGRIRNVHMIYRLDASEKVNSVVLKWLKSLRSKSAKALTSGHVVYSGSIVGTEDNNPLYVGFQNSMDDYLGYNYDDLGTFEISRIIDHPIIQQMVLQMGTGILFAPERESS